MRGPGGCRPTGAGGHHASIWRGSATVRSPSVSVPPTAASRGPGQLCTAPSCHGPSSEHPFPFFLKMPPPRLAQAPETWTAEPSGPRVNPSPASVPVSSAPELGPVVTVASPGLPGHCEPVQPWARRTHATSVTRHLHPLAGLLRPAGLPVCAEPCTSPYTCPTRPRSGPPHQGKAHSGFGSPGLPARSSAPSP